MSVSFSFTNVAGGRAVYIDPNDPDRFHPVATAMAQAATLQIGIPRIPDKAAAVKFFERLSLLQHIQGPLIRYGDGTDAFITMADVEAFIGLNTNGTSRTDAEWSKCILRIAAENPVWNPPITSDGPVRTALDVVAAQAAKYAKTLMYEGPDKDRGYRADLVAGSDGKPEVIITQRASGDSVRLTGKMVVSFQGRLQAVRAQDPGVDGKAAEVCEYTFLKAMER